MAQHRIIWRRYGSVVGVADLPAGEIGGSIELQSPHRAPSVESDVIVPLMQTLTTGFIVGIAAAVIGARVWHQAGTLQLLPVTVAASLALAWLWHLRSAASTLWETNAIVADQDRAPQLPQPPAVEVHPVLVHDFQHQARTVAEQRWRSDLQEFIRGCAAPGGCGVRRWEGKLGRTRYGEFRDVLFRAGAARWRNPRDPRGGWELTAPASAIIRRLMDPGGVIAADDDVRAIVASWERV